MPLKRMEPVAFPDPWTRRPRRTFAESITALLAHLAGAAAVFMTLVVLGWLVALLLHELNAVHPFPAEVYSIISRIEVWLIYMDTAISGMVLLIGAGRFLIEILENRRWTRD